MLLSMSILDKQMDNAFGASNTDESGGKKVETLGLRPHPSRRPVPAGSRLRCDSPRIDSTSSSDSAAGSGAAMARYRSGRCLWIASPVMASAGDISWVSGLWSLRSVTVRGGFGATSCRFACTGVPTWCKWATFCQVLLPICPVDVKPV
jgi:hypothetical protein